MQGPFRKAGKMSLPWFICGRIKGSQTITEVNHSISLILLQLHLSPSLYSIISLYCLSQTRKVLLSFSLDSNSSCRVTLNVILLTDSISENYIRLSIWQFQCEFFDTIYTLCGLTTSYTCCTTPYIISLLRKIVLHNTVHFRPCD